MITLSLIFTCVIILAAGFLLAAYVSSDDFEGRWQCVGTIAEGRFVPYPEGFIRQQIIIEDDRVVFTISGDALNADYSRRRIRVHLTAQIMQEYRLTMEEGRMIVTDPAGMKMVFERMEEPPQEDSGGQTDGQ